MPRGSKSKYTSKQKRKAEHIEEGYEKRGTSKKEAERRAWASVNKEIGAARRAGVAGAKKEARQAHAKAGERGAARRNANNRDESISAAPTPQYGCPSLFAGLIN